MLYVAIYFKGISEPIVLESGIAVNQEVYIQSCLNRSTILFINKNYSSGEYLFWPDKASSHYGKKSIEYLTEKNIGFVPKTRNPTNLPQCRPIEDFFGYMSGLVYNGNWQAENVSQLSRRIKRCIREIPQEYYQTLFSGARRKLRLCYEKGPFEVVH